MLRFIGGFAVAIVLFLIGGFLAVKFGLVPASADVPPSAMERRMAQTSLDATIAREMPQPPYPYTTSDAAVDAGAKIYTQHCAMCHGSGSKDHTMFADGLYIKPPQLGKHGVDDDPVGETFWKVEHGIRFTAMPFYKTTLTEEQIWDVAFFLSVPPDKLPAAAKAEWAKSPTE